MLQIRLSLIIGEALEKPLNSSKQKAALSTININDEKDGEKFKKKGKCTYCKKPGTLLFVGNQLCSATIEEEEKKNTKKPRQM